MEKLELKHLAAYFVHKLTAYGASDVWEIHGITKKKIIISNGVHTQLIDHDDFFVDYSLRLRPLSELRKEIEHNGKTFIPFLELSKIYENNLSFNDLNSARIASQSIILMYEYGYGHAQTWVFEKLCEWNFDVFGLIGKGLAVPLR